MPRRLALSLLIAWLAWVPTVSAQGPGPEGMSGSGFHGMPPSGQYAGPSGPVNYQRQPTLYEQLLPDSRGPYSEMDSMVELGIAETLSQTWFRADFLLFNYQNPSSRFLGAVPAVAPLTSFDPNSFFPVVDRIGGVRPSLQGQTPSLREGNNVDNNGLRLTMGIPTQLFTFEASVFAMGQSDSDLRFDPFVNVNDTLNRIVIPVIPLTRGGLPSQLDFIAFDSGMDVKLRANLQGTDAKLVFGAFTPNAATEVAPLVGFNYVRYSNQTTISGDDVGTGTSHLIDSRANNNIFGPEVGLRMETRTNWLTLGFEPKFTFGINRMDNRVRTSQIFQPTVDPLTGLPLEADTQSSDRLTRFSPVIDLGTYARIRLAENLQLSLGYQFMATTSVSFSERNVVWDSSSILTAPPLIRLQQNRSDFWTHGINLGLQWQF